MPVNAALTATSGCLSRQLTCAHLVIRNLSEAQSEWQLIVLSAARVTLTSSDSRLPVPARVISSQHVRGRRQQLICLTLCPSVTKAFPLMTSLFTLPMLGVRNQSACCFVSLYLNHTTPI